jgi:hypothetical protein
MMVRRLFPSLAVVVAAVAVVVAAADIRVTPLARDGRLLVSFELSDGYSDETRAAIHSGLATTFTFDVELRRGVPLWIDRTIDYAVVSASVQYDNLRRRHQLARTVNGRLQPDGTITEDENVVRRWVTTFERLPLFSTSQLEANAEYYVRVRARAQARNALFLWPWVGGSAWGTAKFTFIP